MRNKPLILLVSDGKDACDSLSAGLLAGQYRVLPAFSGKDAIALASSHCPDLVLLDPDLPDIDGLEVLDSLRAWSGTPVVVVSARKRDEDVVDALDRGADDYVTRPFSNCVLMARIRCALRKGMALGSGAARPKQSFGEGALCIDHERRLVTLLGKKVHLTPMEFKVLRLVSGNPGGVITYDSLRRALWGPYAGDNRTLRVNMANLRRKIERNPADPQFIQTEVGVGYRMMESDAPRKDGR